MVKSCKKLKIQFCENVRTSQTLLQYPSCLYASVAGYMCAVLPASRLGWAVLLSEPHRSAPTGCTGSPACPLASLPNISNTFTTTRRTQKRV